MKSRPVVAKADIRWMSALTNVLFDECPLWRMSALMKVHFDKGLLRQRSASTKVRFDKGPLRQRSASTKVRFDEGPLRRMSASPQPLGLVWKACQGGKHSSLLWTFVNYCRKKVLKHWPQRRRFSTFGWNIFPTLAKKKPPTTSDFRSVNFRLARSC
jgi:hypothetical protein